MKDYFQISQNKYNPLLSESKPIVIRVYIDTKKTSLNFDDDTINGISNLLNSFTKKFSREYNCIGIVNFNEINFIFNDSSILKKKFKQLETQLLNTTFSQEIFYALNNEFSIHNTVIYTKINIFNIFDNKIKSYINHRQSQGFNNYLRYCSYKYLKYSDVYKKNKLELLDILKSIKPFSQYKLNYIKNGQIYKQGYLIEFSELDNEVIIKKDKGIITEIQIVDDVEIDDI